MSNSITLNRAQLRGYCIVPMLTPVQADYSLDEAALTRLVDHIVAGGCQALLVAGTTGEAVSLSLAQRTRLVEVTVQAAQGRAAVFAGIGDNSLTHSVDLAKAYFRAGAAAVVAHLPSYYPIEAEEMEQHLREIADRVSGPLFLYNIPQTTRLSLPLDVVERLSHHPRIVGIKDSEPDGARQEQLARMFAGRPDFAVFCGSVPFTSRAMQAGADGYVPSVGNFAPAEAQTLMERWMAGDAAGGARAQARVDQLSAAYQKGRTVAKALSAMKGVLETLGIAGRHVLPPLVPCTDQEMETLRHVLREVELVS